MYGNKPRVISSIVFCITLLGLGVYHVYAVGQLREQVEQANEDIEKLEQKQINYSAENKSLSEELEELESTHLQKLEKIETYEEQMNQLEEDINHKEEEINKKEEEINKLNKDLQAKRSREEEEARLAKESKKEENDKTTLLSSNNTSKSEQKDESSNNSSDNTNNNEVSTSSSSDIETSNNLGTFTVTFYAVGDGMTPSTTTANGTEVANTIYSPEGYRIIAVDTSVIPMNTIVRVNMGGQSFLAKSSDTGSAIKGNKIDLLVSSPEEALRNGVQTATIEIVK